LSAHFNEMNERIRTFSKRKVVGKTVEPAMVPWVRLPAGRQESHPLRILKKTKTPVFWGFCLTCKLIFWNL